MCSPFLKWPGGKRWALQTVVPIIRRYLTGRYVEPFLGGGAIFFALAPEKALLSDLNPELMNVYQMTKRHPRALINRLKALPVSEEEYLRIRNSEGGSAVERAVRFMYLNRTCFSGVYRVNRTGQFNVPYGGGERTPAVLWERRLVVNASQLLANADLRTGDFEGALDESRFGDVVYCDPTYTVAHDVNGFVRYNERNFAWSDQERLSKAISRAAKRRVTILLSNAHHPSIRAVFPAPRRLLLNRQSTVSSVTAGRRMVAEYLFIWPGT